MIVLERLSAFAAKMGGSVVLLDNEDEFSRLFSGNGMRRGYYEAPFTSWHGLHWKRRIVYAVKEHAKVGPIIHELGHVFCSRVAPEHPKATEWDWLGWEIATARTLGVYRAWSQQNHNYMCETADISSEWGELTPSERSRIVVDRIDFAQSIGVINEHHMPRSVRS